MIGIVGGVGPLAGLDVVKKIMEETIAVKDQDHLPLILSSQPNRIVDRTAYLVGQAEMNPGYAIASIILELEKAGVTVVGIPNHTAHAPRIFDVIQEELLVNGSQVKLLNLVEETARFIKEHYGEIAVGILTTTGTRNTRIYKLILESLGLTAVEPDEEWQQKIHAAIYDETYGLKAVTSVTNRAREDLVASISQLKHHGAHAIILGSSELPLALKEKEYAGLPLIDPNRILARALI